MSSYPNIKTTKFEFVSKNTFFSIVEFLLGPTLSGLVHPGVVRQKGKPFGKGEIPLDVLGQTLGFDTQNIQERLKFHDKALWIQAGLADIVIIVFFALFAFTAGLIIEYVTQFSFILSILLIPYAYVVLLLALKISALTLNRFFAESICISASLHLLVLLSYDDVLENKQKKQRLLTLITFLSNNTRLVAYSYNTPHSVDEVHTHFHKISNWLRKQYIESIFPTEMTIDTLRQDFYAFSQSMAAGFLGNLKTMELTASTDISQRKKLFKNSVRFVGFVIPLLIVGALLLQPNIIPSLRLDTEPLTWVLVIWLLFGIDIYFDLGISSRIIDLIRGVRDL
ncbi:MAG: hypothetical protein MHPDNHAH_01743 [Anaerolineales bacterium]|nr:hypothetical protein [Anaerolineales bacterium]WKZ49243.1 MAG: hypothetical protein QY306_07720 [Anaerolineales bacterium]